VSSKLTNNIIFLWCVDLVDAVYYIPFLSSHRSSRREPRNNHLSKFSRHNKNLHPPFWRCARHRH